MTEMLNCTTVRARVDELLHGELAPAEMEAFDRHLANCRECAAALADAEALQVALLSMPVPPPRPGFAAQALAIARRRHLALAAPAAGQAAEVAARPQRRRRTAAWWGALAAAVAGVAVTLLWGLPRTVPVEHETAAAPADFRLALYEPQEIAIAIDAEQAMPGARLTVRVDGGIALVGFGDTRELSWEADLDAGTNMLALPVLAHSLEQGRLTALVEHDSRSRQIELTLQGEGTPPALEP